MEWGSLVGLLLGLIIFVWACIKDPLKDEAGYELEVLKFMELAQSLRHKEYDPWISGCPIELQLNESLHRLSNEVPCVAVLLAPAGTGKTTPDVLGGVVYVDGETLFSTRLAGESLYHSAMRLLGVRREYTLEDMIDIDKGEPPILLVLDQMEEFPPGEEIQFRKFLRMLAVKSVNERKVVTLLITSNTLVAEEALLANENEKVWHVADNGELVGYVGTDSENVNAKYGLKWSPMQCRELIYRILQAGGVFEKVSLSVRSELVDTCVISGIAGKSVDLVGRMVTNLQRGTPITDLMKTYRNAAELKKIEWEKCVGFVERANKKREQELK